MATAVGLVPRNREVGRFDDRGVRDGQPEVDVRIEVVGRCCLVRPVVGQQQGRDPCELQLCRERLMTGSGGPTAPTATRSCADDPARRRRRSRSRTPVIGESPPRPSSRQRDATVSGPHTSSDTMPALRWNSPTAACVVGSEDAVHPPCVEPQCPEAQLEFGDVVAADHRRTEAEQSVPRLKLPRPARTRCWRRIRRRLESDRCLEPEDRVAGRGVVLARHLCLG